MVNNVAILPNSLFIGIAGSSAFIGFVFTILALLYSRKRNLDTIRDAAKDNKNIETFYTLDIITSLRKMTALSVVFLAFATFAMFAALIYGMPRPALGPSWLFYLNLISRILFPFYVCLPPLLMMILVRQVKRFTGIRDHAIVEKLDPDRRTK